VLTNEVSNEANVPRLVSDNVSNNLTTAVAATTATTTTQQHWAKKVKN
jgi:hypothetical protein